MIGLIACLGLLSVKPHWSAAQYRRHFPLPDGTIPDGWGVNIHFTDPHPGEMDALAKEGFKWVRMDFTWSSIEKQKGHYDFSAYDRLMTALDRHHIRPLFILDYGNDLYEKGAPSTPEARAAFCRFTAAAMAHFRDRGIVWELWNEPNIFFWQPKPNVQDYISLAKEVEETVRRVAPEEWLIGPGTSGFDWKFLGSFIDSGAAAKFDAVSVHPYRGSKPETAAADWTRLEGMAHSVKRDGKGIPVISSEWGYSTAVGGVSEQQQANYAVRMYLVNLAFGARITILYDWINDGPDPRNNEHRFGTVNQDMSPKPVYLAIEKFANQYRGWKMKPHSWSVSGTQASCILEKGHHQQKLVWDPSSSGPDGMPHPGQ